MSIFEAILVDFFVLSMIKYLFAIRFLLERVEYMSFLVTCFLFVVLVMASTIWCASIIKRVADIKIKACFVLMSFGVSARALINLLKLSVSPDTVLQTILTVLYIIPTVVILICAVVIAIAVGKICKGKNPPVPTLVILAITLLYFGLYFLKVPVISDAPLTVVTGVFVLLLCESCISPRLFKTGEDYRNMLENSTIPAVVTNENMEIVYRSKAVVPDSASIKSAIENGIDYKPNDDFIITAHKAQGGFSVFTREIKELNMLLDELNETSQQLQKSNELISREGEIRLELTHAKVLNKLYEESVVVCADKLNCVSAIIRSAPENDKMVRNNMLLKAKLLTSYVRNKFEMLACIEQKNAVTPEMLVDSVCEMNEIVSGLTNTCEIKIDGFGEVDSRITMLIFDWLENICEFAVLFAGAILRIDIATNQKDILFDASLRGLDAHKKFEADKELVRKTSAYNGKMSLDIFSSKVNIKIKLPTEVQ